MPDAPVVLYEQDGPVAVITLNRPERLNAWTIELGTLYFDLLERADADPGVRAIVLTGAGRGFCAGADYAATEAFAAGEGPPPDRRPMHTPLRVRKPLIAAVNGACAGLGLVQALFCDLRFIAADAKVTTAFVRRGLIAEYGIGWILSRMVGPGRAADLLLSGRTLTGEEAVAVGLGERAVAATSVLDDALAYASELATYSSPRAMAVVKRQLRADWDRGLDAAIAEAEGLMHESLGLPDLAEGIASARDKRPPRFAPLDPDARP